MADDYPRTTLILCRHGQATFVPGGAPNHSAPPLSQLGRRQAAALASELQCGPPIDALYTSPFVRARETADVVGHALDLEPGTDSRLAEYQVPGATLETIRDRPDLLVWKPEHRSADGETLEAFCARVAGFCQDVVRGHVGQRVAVVSHDGTIGAQLRWALGIGPASPWEHDFDIANASISELQHWPRGQVPDGAPRYTALLRVWDVSHLGGMATPK